MTLRLWLALAAASFTASGAVITFTADPTGTKANGFSPVGHSGVTLTDTIGADLQVQNFGSQAIGNGLGVFGDDASRLQINFSTGVWALSIAFGNDDVCCSSPGDRAWLEMFNGATSLGTVSVVMNRDDVMNQTISWGTGALANRAVFWYGNATGTPINLIEIVDNIDYTTTPEPASWMTTALGAAFVMWKRRRSA